jgi:hypothetical protein
MTKRMLLSLLVGSAMSGVPVLIVHLNRNSAASWVDAFAFAWTPGLLLARLIPGLQLHDRPYFVWSVVLSGVVYAVVCALLLRWRMK